MDTSFDLTNKKYTKNTNNNDPPNDNDDDNDVDCSPWHNKQPVLPKLITKPTQQETYHADALIPLYELANITISTWLHHNHSYLEYMAHNPLWPKNLKNP